MNSEQPSALPEKLPILIPAGEGNNISAFGSLLQVKLGSEQTNGLFTVGMSITPPSGGPPPHAHHNEDELFWCWKVSTAFLAQANGPRPGRAASFLLRAIPSTHSRMSATRTAVIGRSQPRLGLRRSTEMLLLFSLKLGHRIWRGLWRFVLTTVLSSFEALSK